MERHGKPDGKVTVAAHVPRQMQEASLRACTDVPAASDSSSPACRNSCVGHSGRATWSDSVTFAQLAIWAPDSSFNAAISFVTNTNWQGYARESTMSYPTRMRTHRRSGAGSGPVVEHLMLANWEFHTENTEASGTRLLCEPIHSLCSPCTLCELFSGSPVTTPFPRRSRCTESAAGHPAGHPAGHRLPAVHVKRLDTPCQSQGNDLSK